MDENQKIQHTQDIATAYTHTHTSYETLYDTHVHNTHTNARTHTHTHARAHTHVYYTITHNGVCDTYSGTKVRCISCVRRAEMGDMRV